MALKYLHHHKDFSDLIRIVGAEMSIDPTLVEKDYWIMHCLYGLQQMKYNFELKGGTSLSKGFGIISRFSEDIDIRIEPPSEPHVFIGRHQDKPAHIDSRRLFYDRLAKGISIDGISKVERDTNFDDEKYRSGGIRLYYTSHTPIVTELKNGILLEVGFDDITPNVAKDISSWAYDYAVSKVELIDNRAKAVPCYHMGYTLIEKLQAISTKFRKQQETNAFPDNFMRHYYDVYYLLSQDEVLKFLGTTEYKKHKEKRFRASDNPDITKNEAFLLNNATTRQLYTKAYQSKRNLYYRTQPNFEEIMKLFKRYGKDL